MRNIFLFLAVAVLFVPTFISESLLFPFVTGKNLLFRALVLTIALVSAYFIWKHRTLSFLKTPTHITFLALVTTLGIAALFAENTTRSLWSNFERMEGWFTHALLFLLFVLLYNTIASLKEWRTIFKVSLIANIYVLLSATVQYFGANEAPQGIRLDAALGNAAYLAGYFLTYVFIILWLLFSTKNTFARFGYGILSVINAIFIFLTLTRGGVLGLAVAGFLMAILFMVRTTEFPIMKKVSIGFLTLGIALVGLFIVFKDSTFIQTTPSLQRLSTISLSAFTAQSRLYTWQMSFEGFKESPIIGYGQDNFLYVFSKHFDPRMGPYEPWYDRSHNVFFDWLIAGGIVGLIAYLALYATAFYMLWLKKGRDRILSESERIVWTGFFVAYFTFNLFVFDNIVSYILFVFILTYLTWRTYVENGEKKHILSETKARILAIIILLISISGIIFLVYKPWMSARTLIQAMRYTDVALTAPSDSAVENWTRKNIGDAYTTETLLAHSLEKFVQAAQYPLGRTEAREQLVQKLIPVLQKQNISNEQKSRWVQTVLSELEDELEKDPKNPRMYQVSGSLLLQLGQTEEAIKLFDQAQALSPKKQLIMFDRALAYRLLGDYDTALQISKEAYELNPDFLAAKARYIIALYRAGKDDEAKTLEPQFLKDATDQNYDLVISKSYDKQVNDAKTDYRALRAVQAYEKGDFATYNKYFAEVRALNPDAANRLVQIIDSLR